VLTGVEQSPFSIPSVSTIIASTALTSFFAYPGFWVIASAAFWKRVRPGGQLSPASTSPR
jgi:hypothetical protein